MMMRAKVRVEMLDSRIQNELTDSAALFEKPEVPVNRAEADIGHNSSRLVVKRGRVGVRSRVFKQIEDDRSLSCLSGIIFHLHFL